MGTIIGYYRLLMAINGVQFDLLLMAIIGIAINVINGVLLLALMRTVTINDINAINGYQWKLVTINHY